MKKISANRLQLQIIFEERLCILEYPEHKKLQDKKWIFFKKVNILKIHFLSLTTWLTTRYIF